MTVCGEAENGAIAVEKVRDLRPDVFILDLQMRVMNGLEAAREISHRSADRHGYADYALLGATDSGGQGRRHRRGAFQDRGGSGGLWLS